MLPQRIASPSRRQDRQCEQCGAVFRQRGVKRPRRYCSQACYHQSRCFLEPRRCPSCGIYFPPRHVDYKYCSMACMAQGYRQSGNPGWKGGGYTNAQGYRMVKVDGRDVLEHRHIMEQAIGRPLLPTEHVHHKNHQRADNRLENLEVMDGREHISNHRKVTARLPRLHGRWSYRHSACLQCGTTAIRHTGNGLCRKCYQARYDRQRRR